jgi:hypothetical protein
MNTDWQVPKNASDYKDLAASDRAINFMFGWFLNPVIRGDYPQIMKEQVDRKSQEQGYTTSRLPVFTPIEKSFIKGTSNIPLFYTLLKDRMHCDRASSVRPYLVGRILAELYLI